MARFQTLPLRPVDFVLAYSVPFLAFSLIQIVFTFLIGFVVGLQATVGILVAFLFFGSSRFSLLRLGLFLEHRAQQTLFFRLEMFWFLL